MKNGAYHFKNNDCVQNVWMKNWIHHCHGLCHVHVFCHKYGHEHGNDFGHHVPGLSRGCHGQCDRNEKITVAYRQYFFVLLHYLLLFFSLLRCSGFFSASVCLNSSVSVVFFILMIIFMKFEMKRYFSSLKYINVYTSYWRLMLDFLMYVVLICNGLKYKDTEFESISNYILKNNLLSWGSLKLFTKISQTQNFHQWCTPIKFLSQYYTFGIVCF